MVVCSISPSPCVLCNSVYVELYVLIVERVLCSGGGSESRLLASDSTASLRASLRSSRSLSSLARSVLPDSTQFTLDIVSQTAEGRERDGMVRERDEGGRDGMGETRCDVPLTPIT